MKAKFTFLLGILALLASSCGLIKSSSSPAPTTASETATATVEVVFKVEVPQNTPENEDVFLSIVDEVTGLAHNAQNHKMKKVAEESKPVYQVTLSLPMNTVLKYRYSRHSASIVEYTSVNEPVRYRMYAVTSAGEVHDTINQWADLTQPHETGQISGRITDQTTGQGVPGLMISAGGQQTFTTTDGSFLLPGLVPGIQNLVVYAPDGKYYPKQQGAQVAAQSNTFAEMSVQPVPMVDITFLVHVPPNTPADQVRITGNLHQLGNTFGNLTGGTSIMPERAPKLISAGSDQYGIILSLPAGAEIRYKYTLGDGFWNAEQTEKGNFQVRRLIVPETPTQIHDQIESWQAGTQGPITFNLDVPENTPPNESVSIQFNVNGWSVPQPMWKAGENQWTYTLYSPLNLFSEFSYRYCRVGECGITDDSRTMGHSTSGWMVESPSQPLRIEDRVDAWGWMETNLPQAPSVVADIQPKDSQFVAGVQVMPNASPMRPNQLATALNEINSLHANRVTITPTWSFIQQTPPVIATNPSQDPLWQDLSSALNQVNAFEGLNAALFPSANFPTPMAEWWATAPRDYKWWNHWFDQYRIFALHYAKAAEKTETQTLILGGAWLLPALPGGKLLDGTPANVPADADLRWKTLLEEVRDQYNGTIAWAMPLPTPTQKPPSFLEEVDQIELLWNPPLAKDSNASLEALTTEAKKALENEIYPFWTAWGEPQGIALVINIAYPSAEGAITGCVVTPAKACIPPERLSFPAPDIPTVPIAFEEQAQAYAAMLSAIAEKDWISGVVARGYYTPAILHDKSISPHGKPAEEVLQEVFPLFWRP